METTIDSTAAVRRLLVRTGFAATPDQLGRGFDETLDAILGATATAESAPDLPFVQRPPKGDKQARQVYAQQTKKQMRTLTMWWLDRMVTTPAPWIERRTLLWHGHWATAEQKVKWPAAMYLQNNTERRLGGGAFDVFARAMVVDPALMIWLDASGNTAKAPNENLARELMELFTLGHGNYSEEDVKQAALALTGWRLDRPQQTPTAVFATRQHASGPQTILGTTADFSADDLVNLLVARPASPRYLATRMWGWLVASTPPSATSLDRITSAYGSSKDLTAMFQAIFTDPAFRDTSSVLVKQPIEYVVGALKSLRLVPSQLTTKQQNALATAFTGLGQVPFEPPNVGGWPTGGAWLTTAAAQARVQLAVTLAGAADTSDVSAESPAARPDAVARKLGLGAWTDRTRAVLAAAADDPAELLTLALVSPEYTVSG